MRLVFTCLKQEINLKLNEIIFTLKKLQRCCYANSCVLKELKKKVCREVNHQCPSKKPTSVTKGFYANWKDLRNDTNVIGSAYENAIPSAGMETEVSPIKYMYDPTHTAQRDEDLTEFIFFV